MLWFLLGIVSGLVLETYTGFGRKIRDHFKF